MIKISDLLRSKVIPEHQFERQYPDVYSKVNEKIPPEAIAEMSPRYIGVEVELEHCPHSNLYKAGELIGSREFEQKVMEKYSGPLPQIPFKYFWKAVGDGSLRNGGIEFVSKFGATFKNLAAVLMALDDYLSVFDPRAEANHRTGLHLHVDVRDMALKDLQRLLMLYALYEDALFNYSGGRQKNVFCVPLSETDLPLSHLLGIHDIGSLNQFIRNHTRKYMGLNLKPIGEQGTIEFRMHYGTRDFDKIYDWAFIIHALFRAVMEGPWTRNDRLLDEIEKIDTLDKYHSFAMQSFNEAYPFLRQYMTGAGMEKGLSFVKEISVDEEKLPDELKLERTKTKLKMSRQSKKPKGYVARYDPVFDFLEGIPLRPEVVIRQPLPGNFRERLNDLQRRLQYTVLSCFSDEQWRTRFIGIARTEENTRLLAVTRNFGSEDLFGERLPQGIPNEQRQPLNNGNYVTKNSLLIVYVKPGGYFLVTPAYKFDRENHEYMGVFLHNGLKRADVLYPFPDIAREFVIVMKEHGFIRVRDHEDGVEGGDNLECDFEICNETWKPIYRGDF